ncbi:hypothetical protein M0Q97_02240 [Candidatus Dojkabacteria bacterium]|jgi:hypothetical protein|nr:hypothetical protein [Candidatus Dojkabacteria bacterium]
MKKFISNFKKIIRFIITIFASREFGFVYCVLGTIGQVTHTYFLTEAISSFSGGFKHIQAFLISFFISSSLLFFVSIADSTESKENKRIRLAINIFMFIEILINFYYYSRHLIIDVPQMQIYDFIFAVLISCLLPVTIKLYGGLIRAREWIEVFEKEKSNTLNIENIDVNTIIEDKIDVKINEFKETIDQNIVDAFKSNSELFLNQFENKCNLIIKNKNTIQPINTESEG